MAGMTVGLDLTLICSNGLKKREYLLNCLNNSARNLDTDISLVYFYCSSVDDCQIPI